MDRNRNTQQNKLANMRSLSARRAWIEIPKKAAVVVPSGVALRKESVDRNIKVCPVILFRVKVALRKESVDRNGDNRRSRFALDRSLSARRAWIEIECAASGY